MRTNRRKHYDDEFRREALELIGSARKIAYFGSWLSMAR